MKDKKNKYQTIIFFIIMFLTFYAIFRKKDLQEIGNSVTQMTLHSVIIAMGLSILFVCTEGIIIWYLLLAMGNRNSIWRCIQYSFIGFFYSGITPSATGGQPVQLYYMKCDGNKASDSFAILMTVALAYKMVLVIIGLCLFLLWYQSLKRFMKEYIIFFFLGIFLNLVVILIIVFAMTFPNKLIKNVYFFEKGMIRLGIWNVNIERKEKIQRFVVDYCQTVDFIVGHKSKLVSVFILTMIQRSSMFLLTYIVYRGFHLSGTNMFEIMALQAAIYIAVDMLPVPGAQGITELVYQTVYFNIFPDVYLVSSMLVIRGISFYFLLFVSGIVTGCIGLKRVNTT